ncbi:MAG: folate family ECF transporter S component [Eubacteriales bacterium]|nr:folate family ECF transporter S component [Eubacteriales bacterium]
MSKSKSVSNIFAESAKELKNVRVLTVCALFAALAIVLGTIGSINIGPYVKIGFSSIPNQLVDLLFGPITGAIFSGTLDIVKYFLKPTGPFFFGFTFNVILAGFIYGCFYYKKRITIWRVLAAQGLVALIVNVFLNTLWMQVVYGQAFMVILPARALKNLIMWPINSMIFYIVEQALEKTGVFRQFQRFM